MGVSLFDRYRTVLIKLVFVFLLGASSQVQAGIFCSESPFFGVVDGSVDYTTIDPTFDFPTQITINTNCTFQNFTESNKLTATLNFQTNDPSIYLITFNNVVFTGNMACANIDHRIWFVNGSDYGSGNSCQDLFIPVEAISKQNPPGVTTVGIGEPYTYTLTIPVLYDPVTATYINQSGSANDLHSITIVDDLNATGANLTLIGTPSVVESGTGNPVPHTFTNNAGVLTFEIDPGYVIPAGDQILIDITVVADPGNTVGTQIVNTASWSFGRLIDINGVPTFFDPLPGENGVTQPLTIGAPDLVVNKSSSDTAVNLTTTASFTIDVQNTGGSDAWNATIVDLLPDTLTAGMCDTDPTATVTAQLFQADGVTPVAGALLDGTDFFADYNASTCELSLTMLSAAAVIGPGEHLIINYNTQLDADTTGDGVALTNIAGATQWFSGDGSYPRDTYSRTLTNGTPTVSDHEDSYTITTALSGFYFQKTVANLSSGDPQATTAAPGDSLRYRIRLFNVDQNINDINISDPLSPLSFDTTTFSIVSLPAGSTYTYSSATGQLNVTGNGPGAPLNLTAGNEMVIEFDIDVLSTLNNGDLVSNQASLTAEGGALTADTDDPYVNGISDPSDPLDIPDPTVVEIQSPGPLLKAKPAALTTVNIGQQFAYTITIPATPVNVPLYDVRILDDLTASAADLAFISASVVSGGSWTLTNTGTSTNVVLEDITTGIDIPANGQAVIQIVVEVQNTATNNNGLPFHNTASYTYNRTNAVASSQTAGAAGISEDLTILEPSLTASKLGTLVTAAPLSGGSVIEYVISLTNNGSDTAYNVNLVDTLPAELAYYAAFTPTATIGGTAVTGFIPLPTGTPGGPLIWGLGNGDEFLDIPSGETLTLTYRAQVQVSTAATFNNSIDVDWRSLNVATASERSGDNCPVITPPDDYCVSATGNSFTITDNNSLSKVVSADSWTTDGSTPDDATVRIGDTVTYQLTLSLGEGVTDSVVLSDVLPAGMAFNSLVSISPASGAGSFSYTLTTQPAPGDNGTLVWNFGDVTNTPSNDATPNDDLVITYTASVLANAGIAQAASTPLTNTATLAYNDGAGNPVIDTTRLESSATITVLQPLMSPISKTGNGTSNTVSTPLNVNVATDTVQFQIQSCNTAAPAAPAYSVLLTDVLPTQIDETSLSTPVVTANGGVLGGSEYTYTPPAVRGGSLQIELITPVDPGECVTVDYQAGFHTDFGANQTWNNSATLDAYWSLPASSGQQYGPLGPAAFYMTNVVGAAPMSKVVASPSSGEIAVGEEAVYTITIPATPISAALDTVELTDTLNGVLTYITATAVDGGGNSVTLTDTSAGQDVNLAIGTIPAGEQVIITLRTRVVNNAAANAGVSFSNTASYTHSTSVAPVEATSAALTIVEPALTVAKSVSPAGTPSPGDTLTYSVTLSAASGANFADAFDVRIEDSLSPGLLYQSGTATVNGAGNTIADPSITVNGGTGAQTLVWDLAAVTADIDVVEGTTVTVSYDVLVDAGVQDGQSLTNSVVTQWTGIDGIDANERNGTGTPVENDYFSAPVSVNLISQPGPLLKETTQATATIGEQFVYRITVPQTPLLTDLNDVRILDNLNLSDADLTLVSISKITGSQPWTPVNTGDSKNLVIEDTSIGIDIPAGEQAVIEITVSVDDTATNVDELVFRNIADYTYNSTQDPGLPGTSGDMTIVEPDALTLEKTGPATMRVGPVGNFTINVHNAGTSAAWDVTVIDQLPDPSPGGMCDAAPTNIVASILHANGTTTLLTQGAANDYTVSFSGAPACQLILTMQSAAAAIGSNERLIISYDALLDNDSISGTTLTNIAAATQWFSEDTAGAGASGSIRTYTGALTDGTTATLDEQDAHSLVTESPVIIFHKSVVNISTGQDPGANAQPGDILEYTLHIENISPVRLYGFSLLDDLGALNTEAVFLSNTLDIDLATLPAGAVNNSNPGGGTNAAGLLDLQNLNLEPQGNPGGGDVLDITFRIELASVIANQTLVQNQATITSYGVTVAESDDPNVNGADDPTLAGDEDYTQTLIASSPQFVVEKTSQDLSGDPNVLLAGDILRYTITVKNIGDDNAFNTSLRDLVPSNTTYVANSTTLNSLPVADVGGASPLQSGMLINAPENTTPGYMRADASATVTNVATISFDVQVNAGVANGVIISNQGFVAANDTAANPVAATPSDDPATTVADDPTQDIVGALPLVDAQKTVSIQNDINGNGQVDEGDRLRYTITITNNGPVDASNVSFTDAVPADTTFVSGSASLNGLPIADSPNPGDSPLVAGIAVSSSDLTTTTLPTPGNGVLTAGGSATIVFDVTVNTPVAAGTIISNQGVVSTDQTLDEPTDADGIDSNGDQPTDVVVGNTQQLSISKQVSVVNGGVATADGELEYVVRVTNIASVPATNVVISDNLDLPVAGQMTYVAGSATLNGLAAGTSYVPSVVSADYAAIYGMLAPGGVAELRFRVLLDAGLAVGDTVTNIAEVSWNSPAVTATASASIDVGGTPGSINLNGRVWHDANFNQLPDATESQLENWRVQLYQNGTMLTEVLTDVTGSFQFPGLLPNQPGGVAYQLRYLAPGASATTASMGLANSAFTDGQQSISDIYGASGTSLQNLNLPIQPNGVIYDSVLRTPVAGAVVQLVNSAGIELPTSCFVDPNQQNQLTVANGFYKFELNFSQPGVCDPASDYSINLFPPAGYVDSDNNPNTPNVSVIIPPAAAANDPVYDVVSCPADAVAATVECEIQVLESIPATSIAPRDPLTDYYLRFSFANGAGEEQVYNNHIPVDSNLNNATAITKTSSLINVNRGQLVPYTITINNTIGAPVYDLDVEDLFPAGFKYVANSARIQRGNGAWIKAEPIMDPATLSLTWRDIGPLNVDSSLKIQLLLIAGSGVEEGEYINRARVVNNLTGSLFSGEASATVRVVPSPTFDCSDVIGKVFDDRNLDGHQNEDEAGLAGVRMVTANGLAVTTGANGRFSISCAIVPDSNRGSNFILKMDERTLPTGYRVTTENPRVVRATRGKMVKINFGAAIHRVVRLDMADAVFQPGTTEMRPQWLSRLDLLMIELSKDPSVLRLSYMAENENPSLVSDRLDAVKNEMSRRWEELNCCYKLMIESEVFWRRGGPPNGTMFDD